MGFDVDRLVAEAGARLAAAGDPDRARQMAAYMKTDQPFFGVQSAARRDVLRRLRASHRPGGLAEYEAMVVALWERPHREEQYLAIDYARAFPDFVTAAALPLYRRMIVEGAWWDLVDGVASDLVGIVLLHDRAAVTPIMWEWIDHDDLWLRRTALISQLRHRHDTDAEMLFEFCRRRAHETQFFVRKAIGWALRQYARTDPAAVTAFLLEYRPILSGLSFREAAKHLEIA